MYSEVLLVQYCLALDGLRGSITSQWKYGNRHRGRSDSRTQIYVPLSVASPGQTGRVHAPGKARRILSYLDGVGYDLYAGMNFSSTTP